MQIQIIKFPVEMYIGHLASERQDIQEVFFSFDLQIERQPFNLEDKLNQTVDYGEVMNLITEQFKKQEKKLLETVCDQSALLILENYPKVKAVKVQVEKSVLPTDITKSSSVRVSETYHRDHL